MMFVRQWLRIQIKIRLQNLENAGFKLLYKDMNIRSELYNGDEAKVLQIAHN